MMQRRDVLDDAPELKTAVDAVCEVASSDARRQQIRAHARELVRALRHPAHPLTVSDDLADVFGRASLQRYERLALDGELRDRGPVRPTSDATAYVRSGVMALLQRELGLKVVHLRTLEEVPRKTPVDAATRERLRESLQTVADRIGRQTGWSVAGGLLTRPFPRWVRILALVSIVLDTGARVGELCAIRLEDLSPALDEVRIGRRPQNGRRQDPDVAEVYRLREVTRVALQRWLHVRRLVLLQSEVAGGVDWLWVPIQGHSGSALQPIGVARSYTRTVTTINVDLAGTEGWEPLPVRMEQLRRGVAEPGELIVPQASDTERAAELMERLEVAGRQLAALPDAASPATTGRQAHDEARHVLREAWRIGIEHRVQLAALGHSGLAAVEIPHAGWDPELLRALC
ncbi:hypothetical protein ACFQ0G_53585 [Streptomyces chiangmaiensis]|uniref:hypothetical protein n=1 Tax=Streptomyces chiangmaiensis TaxID=766497 RepID=UPI0031E9E2E9